MVEIFKTNVNDKSLAFEIIEELRMRSPAYKVNFDLDDCDKILRVESELVDCEEIVEFLKNRGMFCEKLEDAIIYD